MGSKEFTPFGAALLAWYQGDKQAELIIRRDDGIEDVLPVALFYRDRTAFTFLEREALKNSSGHVLDVGAGTGLFALALRDQGHLVTAIDIERQAVAIMEQRGLKNTVCSDIFEYSGGPFDTILLLGHSIGMVETLAGLDRFLHRAHGLIAEGGQLLIESTDVRATDDPKHLSYQERSREAGRYVGEIRIQLEYRGQKGPFSGWLHVDAVTLTEHATRAEWNCEVLATVPSGEYLARLAEM